MLLRSICRAPSTATGLRKGPLEFRLLGGAGRFGPVRFAGQAAGELSIASVDLDKQRASFTGLVRTRKVAMVSKQNSVKNWWADLHLDHIELDASHEFDFRGKVRARFENGLRALYVLASNEEIPSWLPGVLPLGDLSVDLDIDRYCRRTDLRLASAEGGPLEASGRVRIGPGQALGAILVRMAGLKPIAMGFDFGNNTDSTVFAGPEWLERRTAPLDAAPNRRGTCTPEPSNCR